MMVDVSVISDTVETREMVRDLNREIMIEIVEFAKVDNNYG